MEQPAGAYTAQGVVEALQTLHSSPKHYAQADQYVALRKLRHALTSSADGCKAFRTTNRPLQSRSSCSSTR